jgi:hypothetical protein
MPRAGRDSNPNRQIRRLLLTVTTCTPLLGHRWRWRAEQVREPGRASPTLAAWHSLVPWSLVV